MQPAESVPTNGRPPARHEEAAARLEIERLRAIRARQAAAIEQLTEDVAMFRRAAIALGIRRAGARDHGDELFVEPVRLDNLSNVERVVDGARPVVSQGPSDADRRDGQADLRDRTAAIRDDIAERREADLADMSDERLR